MRSFVFKAFSGVVTFLLPGIVGAQNNAEGASASTFVNSLPLWIAVAVGFIATFLVFRNARRIGGGVLTSVYKHFGWGMLFVVLGFLAVVVPPWAPAEIIMRTHDALFVIGYLVMAYGAHKILAVARVVDKDNQREE